MGFLLTDEPVFMVINYGIVALELDFWNELPVY